MSLNLKIREFKEVMPERESSRPLSVSLITSGLALAEEEIKKKRNKKFTASTTTGEGEKKKKKKKKKEKKKDTPSAGDEDNMSGKLFKNFLVKEFEPLLEKSKAARVKVTLLL